MNKYLAFDIGASSGRAVMGCMRDNVISLKEIYRFPNFMTIVHGRYHWDVFRLFEEIKKGIKDAAIRKEIPLSIGIDTWGVDYGLLDEAGHILELPYAYRDHRTDGTMDEFFEIIPKEELYELTGIQFLQFNTLFQLYAAKKDKLPTINIAKDLLFIPDLLNYLVSGGKNSEFSIATTSQLCNPRTKSWAPEIFDRIDVPIDIMQDIVDPGTVIGELTGEISRETGIKDVSITAVASHDTGSAVAAVPAKDGNFAYISSGTWSLMGIEKKEPIITSKSRDLNFTNEGGVEGTFRILKNIMGLWLLQECKRVWANTGAEYAYDELSRMAAASKSFKCLIDPDHHSLLNPGNMAKTMSNLIYKAGEPVPDNPGEFARCIFESLAFRYRQTLDELKQISDKSIQRIHIIGGGSLNEVLCQFAANATGLPVISGPAEGTVLGNIMVQAMAQGNVNSLGDIRSVISNSFECREYIPENIAEWQNNYTRFLEICEKQIP